MDQSCREPRGTGGGGGGEQHTRRLGRGLTGLRLGESGEGEGMKTDEEMFRNPTSSIFDVAFT